MFSSYLEKQIPKNFKECYDVDQITANLWQWARNLETIGKIFAIISGIITFISGIVMMGTTEGASIIICIIAPITAFLEYISFHITALLIGSLASIVLNTRIIANINIFKYAQENGINDNVDDKTNNAIINNFINSNVQPQDETLKKITHSWRCQNCGFTILSYPCQYCGWTEDKTNEKDV